MNNLFESADYEQRTIFLSVPKIHLRSKRNHSCDGQRIFLCVEGILIRRCFCILSIVHLNYVFSLFEEYFFLISCLALVEIKVHKDLFVVLMEQGSHCDGKTFKKFKGYTVKFSYNELGC
jgi:hypothetical protein